MRVNPTDHILYTQEQFDQYYGQLCEWDAADANTTKRPRLRPRPPDLKSKIQKILDFGLESYSTEQITHALKNHNHNTDRALNSLIRGDYNKKGDPANINHDVEIDQLLAMGIDETLARELLKKTNGNVRKAVSLVFKN